MFGMDYGAFQNWDGDSRRAVSDRLMLSGSASPSCGKRFRHASQPNTQLTTASLFITLQCKVIAPDPNEKARDGTSRSSVDSETIECLAQKN